MTDTKTRSEDVKLTDGTTAHVTLSMHVGVSHHRFNSTWRQLLHAVFGVGGQAIINELDNYNRIAVRELSPIGWGQGHVTHIQLSYTTDRNIADSEVREIIAEHMDETMNALAKIGVEDIPGIRPAPELIAS